MSAYEELVDRLCALRAKHAEKRMEIVIEIILAEVLRTLETVTPDHLRKAQETKGICSDG